MADSDSGPPDESRRSADGNDVSKHRIRFAQARSVGILLLLTGVLALMLYNTIAEGTPWKTRQQDVRLVLTLFSLLLGVDVLLGNHRDLAKLVGEVLITYSNSKNTSTRTDDDSDTND